MWLSASEPERRPNWWRSVCPGPQPPSSTRQGRRSSVVNAYRRHDVMATGSTARLAAAPIAVLMGLLIEIAGGGLRSAQAVRAQSKLVGDGVYTSEQAVRGQGSYQMACSSCHGPTLGGDAFAPPLVGPPFTERWQEG